MGNCMSNVDQEAVSKSAEIDKLIEEDSKRFRKECKILLLGESRSICGGITLNTR